MHEKKKLKNFGKNSKKIYNFLLKIKNSKKNFFFERQNKQTKIQKFQKKMIKNKL
jgi:hypothetical protein